MKNQKQEKNQYGLISMIAIIIGTVVGSGIYVKNNQVMEGTGSSILATIAWIIGGLLVLAILVSIVEISSITKNRNEQGTINSWTRYFWGPKASMFVGGYFLFVYFPLVVSSEAIFAVNQLFESVTFKHQMHAFWMITLFAILIILISFMITIFFTKTTKGITLSGTIIKIIPLSLIVLFAILIGVGTNISDISVNNIFDPNNIINKGAGNLDAFADGLDGSLFNNFSQVLMVLPPILFAFDGFIYSASLSTEAKSENTYKIAAIISILAITLIYILFSISTFALADVQEGTTSADAFSISAVLSHLFVRNEKDNWILVAMSIVVSISIITAVFGYATSYMWSMSDASNTNIIVDKDSSLLQRIDNRNPYKSGLRILYLSLIAVVLMRGLDAVAWFTSAGLVEVDGGTKAYIGMSDYISNLYTVINFVIYTFVITGGLVNRFTKKVEVDKSKTFIPGAIISIVGMSFVVLIMGYGIFSDLSNGITSGDKAKMNLAIIQLSVILAIVFVILFSFFYQSRNIKKQPASVWEAKKPYQDAYSKHMTMKEYIESLK